MIIVSYASLRDVKELHARILKPLLTNPKTREAVMNVAGELAMIQEVARAGKGDPVPAAQVLARLKAAVATPKRTRPSATVSRRVIHESGVAIQRKSGKVTLEFDEFLSDESLRAAINLFLKSRK